MPGLQSRAASSRASYGRLRNLLPAASGQGSAPLGGEPLAQLWEMEKLCLAFRKRRRLYRAAHAGLLFFPDRHCWEKLRSQTSDLLTLLSCTALAPAAGGAQHWLSFCPSACRGTELRREASPCATQCLRTDPVTRPGSSGRREEAVMFQAGKSLRASFPGKSRRPEQAANFLVPLFPLRRALLQRMKTKHLSIDTRALYKKRTCGFSAVHAAC